MIFWDEEALLFMTGLSLQNIGKIITKNHSEEILQQELVKFGQQYLERYLIMKEYRAKVRRGEQKLPIVILITGLPGVGKSALAKFIADAGLLALTAPVKP